MSHRSHHAGEQVKPGESTMAHCVLEIIPEDPQVEPAANRMPEARKIAAIAAAEVVVTKE